jgi:hypothetical protein
MFKVTYVCISKLVKHKQKHGNDNQSINLKNKIKQ